jgi:DNA-binding response OmpR family regulator
VVSTPSAEAGTVLTLRAGADDVMLEPTRYHELEARVTALARRRSRLPMPWMPSEEVVVKNFVLDPADMTLHHARRSFALSPRPFLVMLALMRAPGRPLAREELITASGIQSGGGRRAGRSLDTYVRQLRKLIEIAPERPRHLLTLRTFGYRFVPDESEGMVSIDTA